MPLKSRLTAAKETKAEEKPSDDASAGPSTSPRRRATKPAALGASYGENPADTGLGKDPADTGVAPEAEEATGVNPAGDPPPETEAPRPRGRPAGSRNRKARTPPPEGSLSDLRARRTAVERELADATKEYKLKMAAFGAELEQLNQSISEQLTAA